MKPESISPNLNLELPSVQIDNVAERDAGSNSIEYGNQTSIEKGSQVTEHITSSLGTNNVMSLPKPVIDDGVVGYNTTIDDNPLIANDEDLIEKEWVDKAKKIVLETRDNPHQREKAVNELQIDYLKKRYGRGLDVAE